MPTFPCCAEDPCTAVTGATEPAGPYPSTLTIDNYDDGLFVTSSPDCECEDGGSAWDGVLHNLNPTTGEYEAFVLSPPVSAYYIKCAGGATYNFEEQAGARLEWDAFTGTYLLRFNGCGDLWEGRKLPGTGPAGRYTRCEGCSAEPPFIDLV